MSTPRFVRRDVWGLARSSLTPPWEPYMLAYARAVGVMRRRPASSPTSWSYQAGMHGTFQRPLRPLWNGCQHGSWFFLPWHRIYIWYFEQIVRSVVVSSGGPQDWALPYWNCTDGPTGSRALPEVFRRTTLPDGSPNPLFTPNRAGWINRGDPMPAAVVSTAQAMASTQFSPGFGGRRVTAPVHTSRPHGLLESQPHDGVHVNVGGTRNQNDCGRGWMSAADCAALDPIFYLHHSNIDRLWARWIASGRTNTTDREWTTQQFSAFDATGQRRTRTCASVGDLRQLDYVYEDMVPLAPGVAAVSLVPEDAPPVHRVAEFAGSGTPPGEGPEIAAADGTSLDSEPTVMALEERPDVLSVTEAVHAAAGDEDRNVFLHLDDVSTDATPGLVWEVRLDPDGAGGEPEQAVGTIAFFGRGHAHGDEEPSGGTAGVEGEHFIFEITGVVQSLEAAGRWDERQITVSFHPALPPGFDEEVPTVRIGRIYITDG